MKYEDFKEVCEWLRDEQVSLDLNENEIKQEWSLFKAKNKALNIPCVMPSFPSPKNWTEDYKHENGNYMCKCSKCEEYFIGYKRRTICRECANEN